MPGSPPARSPGRASPGTSPSRRQPGCRSLASWSLAGSAELTSGPVPVEGPLTLRRTLCLVGTVSSARPWVAGPEALRRSLRGMRRHDAGPRRSAAVYPYLRETRLLAAVAVAGLVAGVAADVVGVPFWIDHPLLAGLTANVIVVLLSVAVLNEVLQNRS